MSSPTPSYDDHKDSTLNHSAGQPVPFVSKFFETDNDLKMEAPVTQAGVLKVEAATRVWGPKSKTFLFIGIGLIAYIYSLDGTTTYQYQAFATSDFASHSLLSSIGVASAIVLAVAKPPAAKIADVFGRAEAYLLAVVLYVIGYIVVASCNNVGTYAGGIIIYTAGQASIQILQQIIIADVTSLRWRGLVSNLVSLPFFVNAFVAPNIGANIIAGGGWRWGYGMFTIIIPVASAPIILTLAWAQRKAKGLGLVATNYNSESKVQERDTRPFLTRAYTSFADLDLFGLLLFAAGWSLLLLPLTLTNRATKTWGSPDIIAMITVGCVTLVAFVVYEAKFARLPIIPGRFFRSRTVIAACVIAFFDFVSFYLQYTYQYSFIYITHTGWSFADQGYFAYTQLLSLTFFAICAGTYQLYFGRLKWLLVSGLLIRLLGVGVMIHTKGSHGSTAGLVITQIIQGAGGGIAACASQTAVQGSVSHQDVAGATAFYLLSAEIGNAIGTAIAGAIWRNTMPGQLTNRLAPLGLNTTEISGIFGSITTAAAYGEGSPVLDGVIGAYDIVMERLLIAATCLAVIPVIASLFIVNIELGSNQNAVEDEHVVEKHLGVAEKA